MASRAELIGGSNGNIFENQKRIFQHHGEVVKSLEPFVEQQLKLLRPVETLWQPSDVLPNLEGPDWRENLEAFRRETDKLSDGFFAVAIFHGITEEGLPTYQTWQNRNGAYSDKTGIDDTPFAKFSRWWTGEENRHGDVISTFLRFSGRINMPAYERSVQSLLRNGFNPGVDPNDSYQGAFYPSSQEEETQDASRKAGLIAKKEGSEIGFRMFSLIAGDEARHALFYQGLAGQIFKIDPQGALISWRNMLLHDKKGIVMPGALMTRGEDAKTGPTALFKDSVRVEIALDGYTPHDYARTFGNLVRKWDIEHIPASGEAAQAQEDIMKLLDKSRAAASIMAARPPKGEVQLPWFDNPISLSPQG